MRRWAGLVALVMAMACAAEASLYVTESRGTPAAMPGAQSPLDYVRYFAPDDPLFATWQWNLTLSGGEPDLNVEPAWARGVTGQGVTIGIVDDCLQTAHPDLAPNYDAADSWDFGQNDGDPSPVYSGDMHGTSVAGVAAARGGNTVGVTGVAPLASVAGLRIDFDNQTEQMFADATRYHSSGAVTSIAVKNHSYGISVPYIDTPLETAAFVDSAAAGTMHAMAAGNERDLHGGYYFDENDNGSFDPDIDYAVDADANKKADPSLSDVVAVAAVGADGVFTWYSNWGACVFVTAPSSGISGKGIATTDRTGAAGYNGGSDPILDADYTSTFGGTSAATPQVAGVLALGKQVNPAMDVRMAKHLLALTSRIVDPDDATDSSDGGWKTNAAGYTFNQNYGFGLVDADAFTREAALWTGVSPLVTEATGLVSVEAAITGEGGVLRNFTFSTLGPLEEVEVYLDITHTWRGDLEAYLTSPSGTTSRLMMANWVDSFDVIDWTFVTNAFWGEQAAGEWALEIIDTYPGADDGVWHSYSALARMGELVPEPATLALVAVGAAALLRRRR